MSTSWNDPDETTQVFDSERVEGAASGFERWYISPDGKSKEVLAAREIIERARAGSLSNSTLVWRDGLSDWTRLDAVPELMQAVRAFRAAADSGELPTVVGEAIPTPPDGVSAEKAGSTSLPSLPAVAGVGKSSLPPLPALPGAPRPPTQTLSGAPLPPPPSLPPLPGSRKSHPDGDGEKPADVSSGAPTTIAKASPLPASSARGLATKVSNFVDKARPVVEGAIERYSDRARVYLDRDYDLPKVGRVSGRLLAAVGGGVIGLLVLVVWLSGDGEKPSADAAAVASAQTVGSGASDQAPTPAEESGLDLDRAEGKPPGNETKAVSLSELKSLAPGEKAPEVTKDRPARSGGGDRSPKAKEFDVYAAKSALSTAASKAARCKQGPKGEGSVKVKIATSGKVVSVQLTTPAFQGTAAGACVEQVFRQASVPAFSGEDKTVFKKFVIN